MLEYGEAYGLPVLHGEDMKTIRITRSGVFRSGTDMIPIGTELEVPDDFASWPGKWDLVSETAGKSFEVATPAKQPEPEPEPGEDIDLEEARAEYEQAFGERPHPRMKADTIRARISEAQNDE